MNDNRYINVRCHYSKEIIYMNNSHNPQLPDYFDRLATSICNHLSIMLDGQEELLNKQ